MTDCKAERCVERSEDCWRRPSWRSGDLADLTFLKVWKAHVTKPPFTSLFTTIQSVFQWILEACIQLRLVICARRSYSAPEGLSLSDDSQIH